MLDFFRRYQTYFFAVITVVIIISFSFFGTYNTLPANAIHEQVVFVAVDNTPVTRLELDEMVTFLGTDNDDKRIFGGIWGPNFLNDGVIRKDFLETGLAAILVNAYPEEIEKDLQGRLEKEKHYTLYSNPQAKFLGVEAAWAYFAPEMKPNFDTLRTADKSIDPEAFSARTALYLAEKQLPSPLLRQVLRYQEKQYSWLTPDPNLERTDLSLFGYHTTEDWFGPRFLRLVSEFIINSSKIAEQKGYQVTKAEALADLQRNSEISFQQNLRNPQLGVASGSEYFNEQLRRMNIDRTKAVAIWRQVMLSRRMFQDIGNAVIVDTLAPQKFLAYANETAAGQLYRLPAELRFADYRALQKFEIYLDAVAYRTLADKEQLTLPTSYLSVETIKKSYPELVQKSYLLQVSHIQKKSLQKKIGLKDMWEWEVDDNNWVQLKKEFPEIGVKTADTRDERFAALDDLDDATRARVDTFARQSIVDVHPEWMQEALQAAEAKQMTVGLQSTGGKAIFGTENRQELIKLLDEAPLGKGVSDALKEYTGDQKNYYRIAVLERSPQEELMTFAEANKEGTLDKLLDKKLEAYYVKIRDIHPEKFQKEDKSWKSFEDVKNVVADYYFEKQLNAIRRDYAYATGNKGQQPLTGDLAASVRFYAYVRGLQDKMQKDPAQSNLYVSAVPSSDVSSLSNKMSVADQWKLEQAAHELKREGAEIDMEEVLTLPVQGWTKVNTPVNGDLKFFHLESKEGNGEIADRFEKTEELHRVMSQDSQRHFMQSIVHEIKDKHAISFNYLDNSAAESIEPEQDP